MLLRLEYLVGDCNAWHKWSSLSPSRPAASTGLDILIYISLVLTLSTTACALTLLSRTKQSLQNTLTPSPTPSKTSNPPSIPAAGSGVREIKLVINNFQFPGYLTSKTVLLKATAMILSTSSALSIGKEGPFVHLGAGVSAWVARVFDVKPGETRRLLLCAGVASGLAVAFGAPVSGVVFVLEEFSLSLKLLEPFGNRMPVLIDVHYTTDWSLLELPAFLFLGALGGILGALFIKACRFWAKTYRRIAVIKRYPMLDILLIALLTGVSSYWNQYTKLGDSELLSNLAATCNRGVKSSPHLGSFKSSETLSTLLIPLVVAFIVKGILTIVSFGLCVPAGIYVPSMAIGALLGKAIGHSVEALSKNLPLLACPTEKGVSCVNPEVYALIGAGAMMCGVTRLPVTLTIILFELTGSLKYVGCFCIAILVAKWVADCIEEGNIYDLVSSLHAYPISSITSPTSTKTLSSILPSQSPSNTSIDITHSPLIPSSLLQQRLTTLLSHDPSGGIIITSHSKPINLLPVEALKTALASLKNNSSSTACLLSAKRRLLPETGVGVCLCGGEWEVRKQDLYQDGAFHS
ncbi:hypothetical protein HYALB_00012310 [Hymenoscyphus albidus]|uniref:Chloride channel protein n=1 Tax=Hymenoscyphus albidus TaxID=595503 RepID=A0A9N9Q1D5_9HELO|nr:hypothetical protein HYALB_00012310 [Hymenoscyphus albidus]